MTNDLMWNRERRLVATTMLVLLTGCGRLVGSPTPEAGSLGPIQERVQRVENGLISLPPQIEAHGSFLSDAYGLGFDLAGEGQEFRFVHTGGTWGSTSLLWVHPERGQGAVIMTNSASSDGAIRFEILLGIAAEYDWPLSQ